MVEVLVAVIVFAIGLLGIAHLQMKGVRHSQNSHLRAIATIEAQEMADRMRANRDGVTAGDYNQAAIPGAIGTDCVAVPCTPTEMALFDLVEWNTDPAGGAAGRGLDDVLPGGIGHVCVDSTPFDGTAANWQCDNVGDVLAIKIGWTERGLDQDDGATLNQRLVIRSRPW